MQTIRLSKETVAQNMLRRRFLGVKRMCQGGATNWNEDTEEDGLVVGKDDKFNLCYVTFGMPMEHAFKMSRQQLKIQIWSSVEKSGLKLKILESVA